MKSEIPKPILITVISVVVVGIAIGGWLYFQSSSGPSMGTVQPKPWGGPAGGLAKFKAGVRGAPAAPGGGAGAPPSGG